MPESSKSDDEILESNAIVYNAVEALVSEPQGPIHINVPLHEPLYETENYSLKEQKLIVAKSEDVKLSEEKIKLLHDIWDNSCGF